MGLALAGRAVKDLAYEFIPLLRSSSHSSTRRVRALESPALSCSAASVRLVEAPEVRSRAITIMAGRETSRVAATRRVTNRPVQDLARPSISCRRSAGGHVE